MFFNKHPHRLDSLQTPLTFQINYLFLAKEVNRYILNNQSIGAQYKAAAPASPSSQDRKVAARADYTQATLLFLRSF